MHILNESVENLAHSIAPGGLTNVTMAVVISNNQSRKKLIEQQAFFKHYDNFEQ